MTWSGKRWQYNYHLVIPFVILLTVLTYKEIRESRYTNPNTKIDYIGASLLGVSLVLMTTAFSEAPTWGWSSLSFAITMFIGLALFISFLFVEDKMKYPLMPVKLLGKRNVLVANVVAFVASFGIFMAYQSITYLLELPRPVGFDLDILSTGLLLMPTSLMQIIGAITAPRLILKTGTKFVISLASVILALFYFILGLVTASSPSLTEVVTISALATLGAAMLNVVLINILTFSIERRLMGVATGMNTVFRLIGGAFGPSIAGSLLDTFYTYLVYPIKIGGDVTYLTVKLPSDFAFELTFFVASIAGAIMVLLGLASKNIRIQGARVVQD